MKASKQEQKTEQDMMDLLIEQELMGIQQQLEKIEELRKLLGKPAGTNDGK